MTKTLTMLLAGVALTAGIGLPAWSAMRAASPAAVSPHAAPAAAAAGGARLILVDDDEEDDKGEGGYAARRARHDDDDDGEGCDDDEGSCGAMKAPAPAGSVAPPQNGLFGNGTPPQVKVN